MFEKIVFGVTLLKGAIDTLSFQTGFKKKKLGASIKSLKY